MFWVLCLTNIFKCIILAFCELKKMLVVKSETCHEKSPCTSPGSYNKLNGYNSTKDSLRSTQTRLRNLRIEISEGGQIGVNRREEKGEVQRLGYRTQPGGHWGLLNREDWDCRSTLCGPSNPAWGNQHIIWLYAVIWSEISGQRHKKTKPWSLTASPHLPRAPSVAPSQC